jgi:hypothetical protein
VGRKGAKSSKAEGTFLRLSMACISNRSVADRHDWREMGAGAEENREDMGMWAEVVVGGAKVMWLLT